MQITIERTQHPKAKPDWNNLGFGKYFTDHMFIMQHTAEGWQPGKIVPYAPFQMDPSAMVLHYGQAVFEGMKAYRAKDGRILLFRPEANFKRLNLSNQRLCIPAIDEAYALAALEELIRLEKDWIPTAEGTSLYIRPFIFATDAMLGVKASTTYTFAIILSPVGAYYAHGLQPVKIYVEDEYVRAVKGGMGFTKTAGNYAASLLAGEVAKQRGYEQVLWLDGVHKRYIEEVGSMNIFFKFNDELVTPPLGGSILGGITRDSIIHMAKDLGVTVNERLLPVDEVFERSAKGELDEVFGSGTAAVVSPVGELKWEDQVITVGGGQMGKLTEELYNRLTGIQWGNIPDPYGWSHEVKMD